MKIYDSLKTSLKQAINNQSRSEILEIIDWERDEDFLNTYHCKYGTLTIGLYCQWVFFCNQNEVLYLESKNLKEAKIEVEKYYKDVIK